MYDREVDVPRLLSFYDEDDQLPDPVLTQARSALSTMRTSSESSSGLRGSASTATAATRWRGMETPSAGAPPRT